MAVLASGTVGMSTFYPDSHEIADPAAVELTILRLIAKLPTLAAWSFKKSIGQPFVYPRNDLGYCGNLLHMMFAVPSEPYEVDPEVAKALDLLLILHADHEQNCITAHGADGRSAAREPVRLDQRRHLRAVGAAARRGQRGRRRTLRADRGRRRQRPEVRRHGQGQERRSFRLMGFGHRVYKNFDPRATIIKRAAERVLDAMGADDPLSTSPSSSRRSRSTTSTSSSASCTRTSTSTPALIYRAIGFPKNMFTVLFAIGRLPGWIAQWQEMIRDPETKIGRPRQVYTGPPSGRTSASKSGEIPAARRAAVTYLTGSPAAQALTSPNMELTILGRSPARPNPGEACAGYLVEGGGSRILLDVGPGVVAQLLRRNTPDELDAVVVSHMHTDHCLDLVTLRYCYPWIDVAKKRLTWSSCRPARPASWPRWRSARATRTSSTRASSSWSTTGSGPSRSATCAWSRTRPSTSCAPGASASAPAGTGEDPNRILTYSADAGPARRLPRIADEADLFLCEAAPAIAERGRPRAAEHAATCCPPRLAASAREAGASGCC